MQHNHTGPNVYGLVLTFIWIAVSIYFDYKGCQARGVPFHLEFRSRRRDSIISCCSYAWRTPYHSGFILLFALPVLIILSHRLS